MLLYSGRKYGEIGGIVKEAMRLSGNWLVVYSLVTTILYQLLRLVFITVQRIYWQLNGTAQKRREARLPHNYERSAQVLDVVLCQKFCVLQATAFDNFLCTHNRFENPQYIVDNDNISLLTINEDDAVFCEAKEKGSLNFYHIVFYRIRGCRVSPLYSQL